MEWKKYDDLYEISEYGEVRNVKSQKELKKRYTKDQGYVYFGFHGHNKKIHRIVATLWVENPTNLPCTNHIDGNKENNHYSNLEWCTQGHNLKEAYRLGLHKANKKIYRAFKNGELVGEWESGGECAKALGLGASTPSVSIYTNRPMYGYTFEKGAYVA